MYFTSILGVRGLAGFSDTILRAALLKKGYWSGWMDSMALLVVLFWRGLKEQLVKQLELPL